jgi:hypothetical protein
MIHVIPEVPLPRHAEFEVEIAQKFLRVLSLVSSFCNMAALQAYPWCSFQDDDISCNTGTVTLPSCNVTEEKKKQVAEKKEQVAEEVRKTQ